MESGSFSQFDSAVPMDNAQQTYECLLAETDCGSQVTHPHLILILFIILTQSSPHPHLILTQSSPPPHLILPQGDAVGCLQNLSTAALLKAQLAIDNTVGNSSCDIASPAYMFYPAIDGVEITDAPWVLLRNGGLPSDVDILLGSNGKFTATCSGTGTGSGSGSSSSAVACDFWVYHSQIGFDGSR